MGYVFAVGNCIVCNAVFSFNPLWVPSTKALTGEKEPVCLNCILRANVKRQELGLEPFTIHPEAYEAADEQEL